MESYFRFEICANGVESCLAAQQGEAHRVELCAGIPEGGTTPSYGEIQQARRLLTKTRLHVIIRPRGGDFVYTELEAERMLTDIAICRQLGADGVVFGCLTREGDIDIPLCQRLMEASRGMSVTFHRAFDRCRWPFDALERIISLGCDRILTSGQGETVVDGSDMLRELRKRAAGRIILLPGGGVTPKNAGQILSRTGCTEIHASASETIDGKKVTSAAKVAAILNAIQ